MGTAFVAAMEDVLDLYAAPYAPQRPVVCLDVKPVVLQVNEVLVLAKRLLRPLGVLGGA